MLLAEMDMCMRMCIDESKGCLMQGARYKVHNVLDKDNPEYDEHTAAVWENAEMFDPKTEHMFRYLQVRPNERHKVPCSACAQVLMMQETQHLVKKYKHSL